MIRPAGKRGAPAEFMHACLRVPNHARVPVAFAFDRLGRPATAEDVAGSILFPASALATYPTEEILKGNGRTVTCG